jgi:uncharacterized protein YdaU (DUF1376 family)
MSVTARNDWHPRYHRDALEGMRSLSLEERGAYTTLLDLMYERGGGVPDDDRFVAGHMGCSTRLWRSIRDRLISAGKISVQDGLIVNARAIEELRSQAVRARKRAESGAKGGRTPRQNGAAANENSDLGEAKTKHNNKYNNLLTGQGGMKAEKARPFFGRLLRDNGLEARDLLPSISKATVSGTQDPQGYLTRAAQAVAKRRAEPTKPKRVGWV